MLAVIGLNIVACGFFPLVLEVGKLDKGAEAMATAAHIRPSDLEGSLAFYQSRPELADSLKPRQVCSDIDLALRSKANKSQLMSTLLARVITKSALWPLYCTLYIFGKSSFWSRNNSLPNNFSNFKSSLRNNFTGLFSSILNEHDMNLVKLPLSSNSALIQ